MYENLRKLRESLGMTQQAFGASVGVSKTTYSNYELGIREPNSDFFSAIADKYNVTVDYLIGRCNNPHGLFKRDMPSEQLTAVEQAHIKKYRTLDEHGKETVDSVLDLEAKRMEKLSQAVEPEEDNPALFPTDYFLQSASAGLGDFNDDQSYETLDLVKRPPKGTSFIIHIDGDSMEPTFSDGDKLFIRRQDEIQTGQIGLFCQGGDLFVKEQGENCLLSHNEAYPPIYPLVDMPIRTIGRVLGVCTKAYLHENAPYRCCEHRQGATS